VSVADGLASTMTVLTAKAGMKSIAVQCAIDPDLPPVHGVGAELNQIWANLIDNALDAAGEGGHVDITARPDDRRVVVEITDDGPGIPPDIRGRIFDPFFTTKGVDATGLGLDVVRRSLEHHDGEIDVESRPGRTVFRVRLPAEGVRSTGRWSRSTTRIQIEE
jgi:signal transduction histidine kinase